MQLQIQITRTAEILAGRIVRNTQFFIGRVNFFLELGRL